ncbi:hypothetical protein DITRI_Ditri09bG0004800 [Diplodiscus trichospermus]
MGCGVSKFDIAEKGGAVSPAGHQLSPVGRRNGRVVVDSSVLSKPLPTEGGEREEHAKGDVLQHKNDIKKVNYEEKEGIQRQGFEKDEEACDKEEGNEGGHDRDDRVIENPKSLSFSVYCVQSLSENDNTEGHSNAGQIKDKQPGDVQNDKKV